jgi:RNA-binding protein
MDITSAERRALRARAHHLSPVVMMGDAGLTPAILREIEVALKSHELIKIRTPAEREARAELIAEICTAASAAPVQVIGKTLVIYRPKSEEDKAAKPRRRGRPKPARRTKRSYQTE